MIFRKKDTAMCRIALCIGAALLVSGCTGGPAAITDETTAAEIIQRAQEASDRNHYKLALEYYETLLRRHSNDMQLVCIGEYEIAFIHYKQKKYPQAREELTALLARYENANTTPGTEPLPSQFRKLAVIVLGRLDEKEQKKDPITNLFMKFKKKKPEAEDGSA